MKINGNWLYRMDPAKRLTALGNLSLEVYSKRKNKFVHLTFFKPFKIKVSEKIYLKTIRRTGLQPRYQKFQFQNLIELKKVTSDNRLSRHMDPGDVTVISGMISKLEEVLDIEIEVM